MTVILDKLGYRDFMINVRTTGMELDIHAKHKVTNEQILCECKAHDHEIGPQDLNDFFGKLNHQRSNNPSLKGLFFSVSGFSGSALKYHEELNDIDKENFRIYGNSEIMNLLRDANLFISDEKLDNKIKDNTADYYLGERYVVYFEAGIYIIQLLLVAGKARNYIILTKEGDLVDKTIQDEIAKLDSTIKSLKIIDLPILEKIILNLLDFNKKTPTQISKEIVQTRQDVEVGTQELLRQKIAYEEATSNSEKLIGINTDIATLTELVKKFTNTDKAYQFMSSSYLELMIDNDFATHVSNRFKLNIDQQKKTNLLTVSRISPSALRYELLGNAEPYENSFRQIHESTIIESEKEELLADNSIRFIGGVLVRTLDDIRNNAPADYLDKKGIRGYYSRNTLRIATDSRLIFDQEYTTSQYIAEAGGPIKVGELVSGGAPVVFKMGITLMDLKEYEKATNYFKKAIDNTSDPKILIPAWNNKGVCFRRLKKTDEAILCFVKVLSYHPNYVESLSNLKECLKLLGIC